jgi:hypothetical protein
LTKSHRRRAAQAGSHNPIDREWLSLNEVSDIYGIKVSTLRTWIKRGVLAGANHIGTLIRVRRGDFEAAFNTRARKGRKKRVDSAGCENRDSSRGATR